MNVILFVGYAETYALHTKCPISFATRDRRTKAGKRLAAWDSALRTLDRLALELDVPLSYLLPVDADRHEEKPEPTLDQWALDNVHMLTKWLETEANNETKPEQLT